MSQNGDIERPLSLTWYPGRCEILAELWMIYRWDEQFSDFIEYNDLGLPLAYAIDNGYVTSSDEARKLINETFELLLKALQIEDLGFETVEQMLDHSELVKKDAELKGNEKGSLQ